MTALIRAAQTLDDPNVSVEQIEAVGRLIAVLLNNINYNSDAGTADVLTTGLLWSTREWCAELQGEVDDWAPKSCDVTVRSADGGVVSGWPAVVSSRTSRRREMWLRDRIDAERYVYGEVRSRSLIEHTTAEPPGETRRAVDPTHDTAESRIPPDADQTVVFV
ncbi:hypothetical protein A5787_22590 [Mycobacterium sp. 852002-50816_SCH5313054-b]|nr:hypothetical protein A5787_22590 [Mycobacterium sp. 852002-50816_SCH5313054-b]